MIARRTDDRRFHVGLAAAAAAAGGVVLMLEAQNSALAAQIHAQTVLTATTGSCPAAVTILNQALQPATITAIAGAVATLGGTLVAVFKAIKSSPPTIPPADGGVVALPLAPPSAGGGAILPHDLGNRPKVQ